MKKKGIYLVQPQHTELKIIYNQKDAEKVGDPSTILKVNKENIKFGQSNDFEKRYEEFVEIFGSNVKFLEVVEIDDNKKLTEFKKHLKIIFNCIKRLEPRVECTGVGLRDENDINSVHISIDYTIVGQQEVQNVDFLLERA